MCISFPSNRWKRLTFGLATFCGASVTVTINNLRWNRMSTGWLLMFTRLYEGHKKGEIVSKASGHRYKRRWSISMLSWRGGGWCSVSQFPVCLLTVSRWVMKQESFMHLEKSAKWKVTGRAHRSCPSGACGTAANGLSAWPRGIGHSLGDLLRLAMHGKYRSLQRWHLKTVKNKKS